MPYLEMAFKEVLRLFPIGAMMQRTISEDIAISKIDFQIVFLVPHITMMQKTSQSIRS